MFRKYALFVGVAALGALVTSCGGDDSGNPTPTPTPTDTSTPTPTPTPTPVAFDLTGEFTTQSTNANYAFAYFTPDGGAETFNGASRVNGVSGVALEFDPELVRFGFPDFDEAVSFDEDDFVSGTATQRSYARTDEGLTLELPFAHVLRVNYELSQDFTRDTTDGTLRATRAAIFFNTVTTDDDITGDLTYTGSVQVVGGDPGTTLSNAISAPDVTFTINAADDSISGTIEIFETVNGTPQLVATLVFQRTTNSSGGVTGGVLNANGTFSGILTDEDNNFAGNFAGALSGPNREEIFILFSVSGDEDDDDDRRFVGSFIGAD